MKNEALKVYQKKQAKIQALMATLEAALAADAKEPITWASVGSLGYLEERLQELNEFFAR